MAKVQSDRKRRARKDARTFVLQEGSPCDDISAVDDLTVTITGPGVTLPEPGDTLTVPCVIASADKGTVRPWCEERGIRLIPTEFFAGQTDFVVDLDTHEKWRAFYQKWIARRDRAEGTPLALPRRR
jgi:hypothetical protein